MKSFNRVFAYIWPQWNRVAVVWVCAAVIAMLYALSFATISPLLTVMMGQEGLHGWVNRKITQHRYGVNIYVPDRMDYSDPNKFDLTYYLRITGVKNDGLVQKAGLQSDDVIIGISTVSEQQPEKVASTVLLKQMAMIPAGKTVTIFYERRTVEGTDKNQATLSNIHEPFYVQPIQKLLSFVPAGDTREGRTQAIVLIIMMMAVVTAVRCLARFYQDYIATKVVQTSLARLREDTFEHSMDVPVNFFQTEGVSNTISKYIQDSVRIGEGIHNCLTKAIREPLKTLALLATAMVIDAKLALIFLCCAPVSILILGRLGKVIKRATKRSLVSWGLMLGKLEETIAGLKMIKIYDQKKYEHEHLKSINRKLLRQQFRIAKIEAGTDPIMETLGMFAGSGAIIFGAKWVFGGAMEPAEFFMLLFCLGGVAESVRRMSPVWNKVQQANAAAERVYTIMDEPSEFEKPDALELPVLKRNIEFRNIVFSYPGADKPVLKGVSLTVQAGHNVAIVGPNGSGKTTLANLIPRFYDPDSGEIFIDGQDIQNVTLRSLRSQIGMVTQNIVTFNDTIAANIAYGKTDADESEIINAAKRAFAHDFISALSNGYDTIIGEQGAGLSGGQLQRIVIARAILKDPAILIFDEATSQIDAESEAKIHQAIEEIMRDRTTFIIAHRFSTVVSADIIVVMDEGRITAQGSHEQLMQSCRLYQGLYKTQLIKA